MLNRHLSRLFFQPSIKPKCSDPNLSYEAQVADANFLANNIQLNGLNKIQNIFKKNTNKSLMLGADSRR